MNEPYEFEKLVKAFSKLFDVQVEEKEIYHIKGEDWYFEVNWANKETEKIFDKWAENTITNLFPELN